MQAIRSVHQPTSITTIDAAAQANPNSMIKQTNGCLAEFHKNKAQMQALPRTSCTSMPRRRTPSVPSRGAACCSRACVISRSCYKGKGEGGHASLRVSKRGCGPLAHARQMQLAEPHDASIAHKAPPPAPAWHLWCRGAAAHAAHRHPALEPPAKVGHSEEH